MYNVNIKINSNELSFPIHWTEQTTDTDVATLLNENPANHVPEISWWTEGYPLSL